MGWIYPKFPKNISIYFQITLAIYNTRVIIDSRVEGLARNNKQSENIMKSIIEKLTKEYGAYLELTTVWNYHGVNSLGDVVRNKKSNLFNLLSDRSFISESQLKDGITLFVGAKGRSQHSESQVIIFRGCKGEEEYRKGREYITFEELVDYGVIK